VVTPRQGQATDSQRNLQNRIGRYGPSGPLTTGSQGQSTASRSPKAVKPGPFSASSTVWKRRAMVSQCRDLELMSAIALPPCSRGPPSEWHICYQCGAAPRSPRGSRTTRATVSSPDGSCSGSPRRPGLPDADADAGSREGIGVEHEDLRARGMAAFSSSTPRPEVLAPQDLSSRSRGRTSSTNVSDQYI
jgi:hypothetical protein